ADRVLDRFGCREYSFDPEKGFFLNGRSYPLRGVSRHQDRMGVGNALTKEMHEEDMDLILSVGANSIRLAHYQHDQYFYDLCDEKGMVVWAEIPYITVHMEGGRENTVSQMKELITQNYNHASIICWALSNEITLNGVTEDLLENHRILNDLVHTMDPGRVSAMANLFLLETDSPLVQLPDIRGYNLYYGWYVGDMTDNEVWLDDFHAKHPDTVIGLTEYGGIPPSPSSRPGPKRETLPRPIRPSIMSTCWRSFQSGPISGVPTAGTCSSSLPPAETRQEIPERTTRASLPSTESRRRTPTTSIRPGGQTRSSSISAEAAIMTGSSL
ncbi:MAG: hypothetical protein II628_01300, partial [Lachnospiraceae bacterium]|nr:hypothetical protein [Lachnospiraceae bacterium]